jgi:hypothetical protein
MQSWGFLTNHARVLLCIARDPGARLRGLAASAGITERSAYGIVTDLAAAGYVVKLTEGRRNRYQIQAHLPLREPVSQEPAIGEVLALLAGRGVGQHQDERPSEEPPQVEISLDLDAQPVERDPELLGPEPAGDRLAGLSA